MYKIAICGQANSGKNTVSKIITKILATNHILQQKTTEFMYANIAFATPIKAMIRLMFPTLPEQFITGPSCFRNEIIPNAVDKNGNPLTVRQLHIDLGTELGRSYNEDIWINNFDLSYQQAKKQNCDLVIVPDVRMINEFNYLRKQGFSQIRLLRHNNILNNHITETEQNKIKDEDFDFILNNNGSLEDLEQEVLQITKQIRS